MLIATHRAGLVWGSFSRARRALVGAIALVGSSLIASNAHAFTSRVSNDFESGGWSFYFSGNGDGRIIEYDRARSPSHVAFISTSINGAGASEWGTVYKKFTTPVNADYSSCSATVYLQPLGGFRGALELINPADFTYIGYRSLNLRSSNTWTSYTVTSSYPCSKAILFRVTFLGSGYQQVLTDDASVTWVY